MNLRSKEKEVKTMSNENETLEKLPEQMEFLADMLRKSPYDKKMAKEVAIAIAKNVNSITSDDGKRTAILILNYHQYAYTYVQPHLT